jgi:hypothetical protein
MHSSFLAAAANYEGILTVEREEYKVETLDDVVASSAMRKCAD